MSDFISKTVNILIIFTMALATMILVFTCNIMMNQRMALSKADEFIEQTADIGYLTADDLDHFYIEMNNYGMLLNVDVEKLQMDTIKKDNGDNGFSYTMVQTSEKLGHGDANEDGKVDSDDNTMEFSTGDIVRVRVQEVGMTALRRFIYNIIGMDTGSFHFTLAAAVRNEKE